MKVSGCLPGRGARFVLLWALLGWLIGCGGGGSSGGAPSLAPAKVNPQAPKVHVGVRVMLMPIGPDAAAQYQASRTSLEAAGYLLSPDGSVLVWPEAPAAGWWAQIGSRRVLLDTAGNFTLDAVPSGVAAGTLQHPAYPAISTTFKVADAAAVASSGGSLIIPQPFSAHAGPSGMGAGSVTGSPGAREEFCGGGRAIPVQARSIPTTPSLVRPPPLSANNLPRELTYGPLGSYPASWVGQRKTPYGWFVDTTNCLQFDGFVPDYASTTNFANWLIGYVGST